jgi:glycosyltransferase involved in cell wall biosynthesis
VTGLLVPIDDPAELASAVQRLADEDGLWQGIRRAALECITEGYTQERITARILAELEAAAAAG